MIEVVILAGGLGKRLRDIVPDLPKPLAPIGSKPFISLLFDQLLKAGIDQATLAVGYKNEKVMDTFGHRYKDLALYYVIETELLGTGGAIANALKGKDYEHALIMNGDSFCNISLRGFIDWHLKHKNEASLVMSYQEDRERYGGVEYDEETNKITSFIEKKSNLDAGYINAGIYLFSKEFIDKFPRGHPLSLETQVLSFHLKDLYGWPNKAEFIDIGTPNSYDQAQAYLEKFL
jgi:D-glycero-alpha-D-manno-heptose 1-phosphate guanylyltransferase